MNSEKNKTFEPHVLILNLTEKLDLRRDEKGVTLPNLSICHKPKNIQKSYKNNKFKTFVPTWNDEFELPDGSYSMSDIQDYFEYILTKHGENIENPSIRIYINKITKSITFKIQTGYYLELSAHTKMKLLGSTKNKVIKKKMMKMYHI